jgi:pSer/pThr/pTyr-binding forkhead associated (FHA) protein
MPRITITVPEKNAQPYRFQLDRQMVTLGRGSDNDIAIESGSVSVHHAEMRRVEGGYELHDAGSTNGIKLDGVHYEVIPLHSGSTVKIGDVSFDFALSEEESEALAREKPPEPSPITREAELPAKPPRQPTPSGGSGFGAILIFLILAAGAFFAGLAIRHQKDTGESLIQAIKAKTSVKASPAPSVAPAPVK